MVLSTPNTARAQDIAGNYRLTNDSTSAEVPEWGSDCGQRPESHRGSTGRAVRVSMDGNNVVIEDRPRMRSDGCWSQNPRVRRTGGGGSAPRWTSQCSTPADDYQHEEATYTTSIEGTRIVLHLKKEAADFLESWKIESLVKAYSDHIAHPIMLATDKADEQPRQLNSGSAIWVRAKSEVTSEQHKEFYGALAHASGDPALTIHYRAEGRH